MNEPAKRVDPQSLFLGLAVVAVVASIGFFALMSQEPANGAPRPTLTLEEIPFDGNAAYEMLKKICDIGPRISGSEGMQQQQEMLAAHFEKIGAQVEMQKFDARDPRDGSIIPMANLIARWHPERTQRVVLCAHYDTRPFPDRDPIASNRTKPFIGANDGGSGVALLTVLGKDLGELEGAFGVDIVLFDGEEYVFDDKHPYFLGSTHFAQQYLLDRTKYQYRWGILLDMVGDKELLMLQEVHGLKWDDSRPLVKSIWRTAKKLGVREFVNRPGVEIKDDHLPLHNIGKIPCCDLIDFDYPRPGRLSYWHTTYDTADKCSALSLAKVGYVVHEWLKKSSQDAAKSTRRSGQSRQSK